MGIRHMLIAALAAVAPIVQGTQIFSNHGTLSGWDDQRTENKGKISEVTNIAYEGGTALKFEQTYDPSYSGRYHAEVRTLNGYARGETRFYGFAFRLQSDWQSSPAQSYNIAQFIGDFGSGSCDEWAPTTMVWVIGNRLMTRVKSGTLCSPTITSFNTGIDVTPGVWHKVVMQVKWRSDNTGYLKLWYDGTKVVEQLDIKTTIDTDVRFQFRVGLYANGWHDSGYAGTQPVRQVWVDEIAIGDTFADADPDQW
ncbi:polysaccharide lyase [Pseudoneurospora amorphoporcata]|uniref:Polysaccharide lyase n=1 Tax=Pseudoneurospora amorphoporcata TaxID=241081 RepID=A0AAN6NST3_9PEZI|nr:polysaccharide lyase [Pseudoneurospora amorphoporcata]